MFITRSHASGNAQKTLSGLPIIPHPGTESVADSVPKDLDSPSVTNSTGVLLLDL